MFSPLATGDQYLEIHYIKTVHQRYYYQPHGVSTSGVSTSGTLSLLSFVVDIYSIGQLIE
jgi:hypothetical protein